MFEQYTYETILQEMIDETSPRFDVSETTPLYASYAMSAMQTAKFYRYLDRVRELGFASTSEDEYLEKRTSEMGIFFNSAVASIRKGHFNIHIPVGTRFFVHELYFVVVANESDVLLQCENRGVIGNVVPIGTEMLPVENIQGLETATLGEIIIPGSEKESDNSLFERYQDKVVDPATSGNKAHYRQWARDIEGVGAVKVFSNWDGPDTVKVMIVDTDYKPASPELVDKIQKDLDPVPGQGDGKAPVGAFVTVESAVQFIVNVTADVEVGASTTVEEVQSEFEKVFAEHLKSIAFKEDVEPIIRHRFTGSLLLNIPGVIDYTNLLINGQADNITLGDSETPVVGQVTLNVK